MSLTASDDLLQTVGNRTFTTVPADPPWQFQNRTGKMAPEHKRLSRFARGPRDGWFVWGNQSKEYSPTWDTYSNHSRSNGVPTEQIRFEYDAAQ